MIPAIGSVLGAVNPSEWTTGAITDQIGGTGLTGAGATGGGSFGGMLSNALDSLEQTQASGTTAAQGLATGQLANPTQAVTAVENASLEMDLASQLRNKLVDATTNIFSTQI